MARKLTVALEQLLHPTLDPEVCREELASGLDASPSEDTGEVVFTAEVAESLSNENRDVILVRNETSPEDSHGVHAAGG
jgi:pyruvate,orthophosphate dikinase